MPRNQSGTYTLPSGNPVVAGSLIEAAWANTTLSDIGNEMTDSLSRSGEGGMLAPLRLADGAQTTPGLAFVSEVATGFYRAGTGNFWAVASGIQIAQFTVNGVLIPAGRELTLNTSTVNCPNNLSFDSDTLFIDATNDRVGIGTSTPYATFTVVSSGTNNTRGIAGEHYDNTTAFSQFKFVGSRARGNRGNPSAVLLNDSLSSFNGRGYKATGWSDTVGGFYIYAAENWTDSATGTYMTFRGVVPGGTTVGEWARITSTGINSTAIGATTPSTGAFTSLAASGNATIGGTLGVTGAMTLTANPTLNAGTANGVLYLNGSKVATSGSGLIFDGTNLGVGISSTTDRLNVGAFSGNNAVTIGAGTTGVSSVYFGDGTGNDRFRGYIDYAHTTDTMVVGTSGAEKIRVTSAGNVGIGTNSPGQKLTVAGTIESTTGGVKFPDGTTQTTAATGAPTMNIVTGTTQTAVADNHYVLTNASATTLTLPASPAAGAVVWVTVANGRVDNVIARNSQNINSLAENMTIDNAFAGIQLRFADATRGWVFT